MATAPEVNYSKSNISLKTPPKQGENVNLFLRPGDEVNLGVDLSKAELQIVGGDVIATLPNGGQITFVSMGMMAFENNAPIIKLPSGVKMDVGQILNTVQDIGQAPKDAILVSGPVKLQDEKDPSQQTKSKAQEAPVNDYNAYYVDPQPNVKPQDDIGPKENVGKYLTEAVSEFTSNEKASSDLTKKHNDSESQTKTKDNIADVSAALSFDIGFYQIKSSDSTAAGVTTVLGGTGSALGNVSKSAAAQFQPETLDYRNNGNSQVITVDDPNLVNATYLTKLVRMSVSQPVGFGITDISIIGLSSAFQILNANSTAANSTGGGWSLSVESAAGLGDGFSSTKTDGGEIIEFYIRYEPNSINMALNFDYLMKVSLTSQFDIANVPLAMQSTVITPVLDTLTNFKDVGVVVKTVNSEADYTYTGQYQNGFVLDDTPNENIVYTGQQNSTVYGGLSNDTIYGNIGNDTLNGDKGNDTISGGAGTNIINGGDGIDTASYEFVSKYSDDFLFANGAAIDPATGVVYANDTKGVTVDLQAGSAVGKTVYDATADVLNGEETRNISDTLSNIEYVVGSKYDDTIRGDVAGNKLVGGEGNDTLEGRGGVDWLDGGAGNDWLIGSTDDYMIDGGDNTDTADFANNSNGVEVTLNNSSNGEIKNIGAAAALTKIKNVENVAGSQFKDIITGDNSNNLLIGGYDHSAVAVTAGDDTIIGGAGADTIVGDMMVDSVIAGSMYAGSDLLKGGNDNDIIYGDSAPISSDTEVEVSANQAVEYIRNTTTDATLATIYGGNDTIQGGAGDDYINGGSGFDTVDFSSSNAKVYVNLNTNTAIGEGIDQIFNIENIIGSSSILGDTLTGNSLVNTITGSGGGDTISGLGGNDTLDGKNGSDWADYGYSNGVVVNLATESGVVSGGGDTDRLISIENVIGSNQNDTLTGVQGTVNTLLGRDGDDLLYGFLDGDTLDGGSGSDSVDYGNLTSKINVTLGGTNSDKLIDIENIYASSNQDTLIGNSDKNILDGRASNDTLNGMGGEDTLYGGDGDDILIGGSGADTLYGGDDQDTADYSASNAITVNLAAHTAADGFGSTDVLDSIEIVKGSSYQDVMTGSNASDTLIGGGNNDTFFASGGSDIYYGGDFGVTGNTDKDRVDYSVSGADNIFADLSTNSVYLRNAVNTTLSTDALYNIEEVYGTDGNDTMRGGSGSNTLYGGDGNDTLTGNMDGDYLDGASGTNLADYSAKIQNLTADLSLASKNIYVTGTTPTASNSDTLTNIQNISTGSGNDTITGNSGNNVIKAGSGNDALYGGAGADALYGEVGDDTFIGGEGNDTFYGGTDAVTDSGNDTADYSSALFGIDANLTTGFVTGNAATEGTDTLYGVENITGSTLDDTIKGKVGVVNTLKGGNGNDTIYGGLDGDYLDGGTGTNTVDYSAETTNILIDLNNAKANYAATPLVYDTLLTLQNAIAGSGDDTLIGKSGTVNVLKGGGGADLLTGNLDGDTLNGEGGVDTLGYSSSTVALTVDMSAQTIANSATPANKDYFTDVEVAKTGTGADLFTISAGSDDKAFTLDGAAGLDTLDYGAISEGITLTMAGAVDATVVVGSADANDDVIKNIENIKGSKVADTITGDSLANSLYGNEGNDTLSGGLGNDVIYGGADNDKLYGGAGSDSVYGDAGDDTIIVEAADVDGSYDRYDGGVGSDTIDYSVLNANLTVTLNGSSAGSAVTDNSNIGADALYNIENVIAGSGADVLNGDSQANTLIGNGGADTLKGNGGADVLYGDDIADTISGNDILEGGDGDDSLYGGQGDDTLRGGAGNDTFYGGADVDTLDYSLAGVAVTATLNSSLITGEGADIVDISSVEILKTGNLADVITMANSGVLSTIYAGGGNDIITGGNQADTVYGELGNDTIRGGGAADILSGGDGDDLFYGNTDGDVITGGEGSESGGDTVDFSDASADLVIDMAAGTVNATASTFSEIENITGGTGNDTIYGDASINTLKGGNGNDTIFTSAGVDYLDGGSGSGDWIDFSAVAATAININLSTQKIINDGFGNTETILNVENINGGAVNDTLYGDGMANTIYGNSGADTLQGNDGTDLLYGGIGNDVMDGGADDDRLYGEDGNDTLTGGSGADTLDGGAGDDIFVGGSGNDTFVGGNDVDVADYRNATAKIVIAPDVLNGDVLSTGTLSTSEGVDVINDDVEIVYGSNGFGDTITGNANNNTLYGWGGNDILGGGTGDDVVYGGDGNDIIAGGDGADTLSGGNVGVASGTDTVDYSADTAAVTVNLSSGFTINGVAQNSAVDGWGKTDSITNFYKILGSAYNDTLIGKTGADDYLQGNNGDDWFVMTTGNDIINGGANGANGDTVDFAQIGGSAIVNLALTNATGAAGVDLLTGVENVSGTLLADTITGDGVKNIIIGRTGNDIVYAGAGADVIYGDDNTSGAAMGGAESGADTISGEDGADTIYGGQGIDSIYGGADNDTIYGGEGDDYIEGNAGTNTLQGNDGNDLFVVHEGNDTITGGSGTDTVSYYYAGSGVSVDISNTATAQTTGGGGSDRFTAVDVENLYGSNDYADTLTGNSLANTIRGYGNNDTVYGGSGADILYGDDGSDTLNGGDDGDTIYGGNGGDKIYGDAGADSAYGGSGDDTFYATALSDGSDIYDGEGDTDTADYSAVNGKITVTMAGSANAIVTIAGGDSDTIVNVENFVGGSADDTITGDGSDNYLTGNAGADTIKGGNGADRLYGSAGADILYGEAGNDTLDGGNDDDTLMGGAGNDTIIGGSGSDWLDYSLDGIAQGASTDLRETTNSQYISALRGNDLIQSTENIKGTAYNDNFTGDNNANSILGEDGDDNISGMGGADELYGGNNGVAGDTVSYYWQNKVAITLDASGNANATVNGALEDHIYGFENVSGSDATSAALNTDTIIGNDSKNSIWGNRGADTLYGAGGNDYIDGGADNDTIRGGDGADTIYGGDGNDLIRSGGTSVASSDSADGDSDTIYGNNGSDTIYGMLDGDTIYGGDASTDTATDILRYDELSGKNIYVNLSTNQAYEVGNSSVKDTITGFEWVISGDGNDSLVGSASSNSIVGNGGDDIIERGTLGGTDYLYGDDAANTKTGNDTFRMSKSDLTSSLNIFGGQGVDTVELKDTVLSSDSLVFSYVYGVEKVQLFTGNNTVSIDLNDATLLGNSGNDTFKYASNVFDSHDTIDGGTGVNTLLFTTAGTFTEAMFSNISNIQNIQLANGANTTTLDASAKGATITGGTGIDIFKYSVGDLTGIDTLIGGTGDDTVSFLDTGDITSANLSHVSGVEYIQLATGTSTLNIGTGYSILGSASDDVIIGGSGVNNTVNAGSGNDTFKFAISDFTAGDTIDGGIGTNTLEFTDNGTVSSIVGSYSNIQKIQFSSAGTNDVTLNIDGISLVGGNDNDTFNYAIANLSSADIVVGGAGNDTLAFSNSGAIDATSMLNSVSTIETIQLSSAGTNTVTNFSKTGVTLIGGSSIDNITGTAAANTIYGASGNDVITGGGGADLLYGDDGDDIFNFTSAANLTAASTIVGGIGNDTIVMSGAGTIASTKIDSSVEFLQLAAGTNTINLGNISILGTTGNDSIIGGAGVNNTIYAGAGIDTAEYALGNLAASDTIDGGTSTDIFKVTGAGTLGGALFQNVTSFETLNLSGFSGTATLDSSAIDKFATVDGSAATGALTVDVSSYTTAVSVTTGSGADIVKITSTQSATVNTNTGTSDIVQITDNIAGGASISATISGAETIQLANGGNNATLNYDGVSIVGGSGDDTFNYSAANFSAADIVNGNGGVADTLSFTTGGAISGIGSNITGVENIQLSNAGNTLTLSSGGYAVSGGAGNDNLTVSSATAISSFDGVGGSDTMTVSATMDLSSKALNNIDTLTINAGVTLTLTSSQLAQFTTINGAGSLVVTVDSNVDMSGKTVSGLAGITYNDGGAHTITGSGGTVTETYNISAASTIDGNGGTDNVNVSASIDMSGKLQDVEALNIGANNVTISSSDDSSFALSGGGNLSIDASGVYSAASITGKGVTINGSGGVDTITGTSNDDVINGNGGTDELHGGLGNDTFVLDFANLDSVFGDGGTDTVQFATAAVADGSLAGASFANIETLDVSLLTISDGNADTFGLSMTASGLDAFTSAHDLTIKTGANSGSLFDISGVTPANSTDNGTPGYTGSGLTTTHNYGIDYTGSTAVDFNLHVVS
jgi:Ca2+-binding RTX toxin-like protein